MIRPLAPWRAGARAAALHALPALCLAGPLGGQEAAGPQPIPGGEALYRAACAACHGADGTGTTQALVGFDVPLPDFTDCSFASREPDADWIAVAHQGGPVRGFSRLMPAFGDALTVDELQSVMDYIRTFCGDDDWPRGELNLPRAQVTEKAYPEDELVFTTVFAVEGAGAWMNEFVYEKRFGARNQWEVAVPFGVRERATGEWTGGMGDIALGVKRALLHSLGSGTIFSAAGEIILPTGDEDDGFGAGTAIFEPFVALGQLLPADAFVQLQAGAEFPFDRERAEDEGFWRAVIGWTWTEGRWGRAWSPMLELLGARELSGGPGAQWDVLPQVQVTLSRRQHVMANIGVRVPLKQRDARQTELWIYLLWDWFDGGFFEGW
ncbi:MAG TPA: c-type cytochrome [Longimicrobiales bacterium]